ncbi:ABC transporter permease [Natronolimnohabitans innermongolicus]|uniref:ABC transporter permease n=1 Tax=Natronolimnohabitans innermongolicus JCM 12255 TaxID=1227499 RepID=L9XHP7_9EURY|nr:ABC transporter permease [Natronolimnohabitans innermongolicus]ELY60931.1 hypothetical protein C493_03442 [Natronolimnohabitans innermongolicus JCM 12255]
MSRLTKLRAIGGLSLAQLRHSPARTILVVLAIALAVLAVTLLASLGLGVLETGEEQFADADQDVWVTGGGVEVSQTGGIENPITDAHQLAATLEERDDVDSASPLAFHAVYVGDDPDDLELVTGVGVPSTHGDADLGDDEGFSEGNVHYADGDYDGPLTEEIIVDESTAEQFDVGVGDTIHAGTSPGAAADRELEVVGVASTYSQFLGTPTVTLPISELQQIAGTTGSDRATFVTLSVADGAEPDAVRDEVADSHPEYDVQTSDQQLESMLEERVLVLASGITLVVLAVVAGIALTVNVLAVVASQQRETFAALHAIGLSRSTIAGLVGGQGVVLGFAGGALGLLATPAAAYALEALTTTVVGFEGLLRTPPEVYVLGGAIALVVGTIGALVAGWRAGSDARLETLEST